MTFPKENKSFLIKYCVKSYDGIIKIKLRGGVNYCSTAIQSNAEMQRKRTNNKLQKLIKTLR